MTVRPRPLTLIRLQRRKFMPKYVIGDPAVGGTDFIGLEHVWRTQDNAGSQAYLDQHCNEQTGDFQSPCGDWQPLGSGWMTAPWR